jgi:hypothetical protein
LTEKNNFRYLQIIQPAFLVRIVTFTITPYTYDPRMPKDNETSEWTIPQHLLLPKFIKYHYDLKYYLILTDITRGEDTEIYIIH